MADVRLFRGVHFDFGRVSLSEALCPPYDVISPVQAAQLRRGGQNVINVELPRGSGAARYREAARAWKSWSRRGLLVQDVRPCLYACEERFRLGGRQRTRCGFFAALGATPDAVRGVVAHERTLPKPRADRLKLLKAVGANVSPVFGLFPDPGGSARKALACARRAKPLATGRLGAVSYRLWRVPEGGLSAALLRHLKAKKILIADGHHRYAVGRCYYKEMRAAEASAVLAYFCPEEDPGLEVWPTHRLLTGRGSWRRAAEAECRLTRHDSAKSILRALAKSRNLYAFGLFDGAFALAEPRSARSCRSGLCVEWLNRRLLSGVDPQGIEYTPDSGRALAWARRKRGTAILVKPFAAAQIRKAVAAVGLLPPKSTYFQPKVPAGLVFKAAKSAAYSASKSGA